MNSYVLAALVAAEKPLTPENVKPGWIALVTVLALAFEVVSSYGIAAAEFLQPGLSVGPTWIRPSTASSQPVPSSPSPHARSQTQRAACCEPQLWPTMPGQPSSTRSSSTSTPTGPSGCSLLSVRPPGT